MIKLATLVCHAVISDANDCWCAWYPFTFARVVRVVRVVTAAIVPPDVTMTGIASDASVTPRLFESSTR